MAGATLNVYASQYDDPGKTRKSAPVFAAGRNPYFALGVPPNPGTTASLAPSTLMRNVHGAGPIAAEEKVAVVNPLERSPTGKNTPDPTPT